MNAPQLALTTLDVIREITILLEERGLLESIIGTLEEDKSAFLSKFKVLERNLKFDYDNFNKKLFHVSEELNDCKAEIEELKDALTTFKTENLLLLNINTDAGLQLKERNKMIEDLEYRLIEAVCQPNTIVRISDPMEKYNEENLKALKHQWDETFEVIRKKNKQLMAENETQYREHTDTKISLRRKTQECQDLERLKKQIGAAEIEKAHEQKLIKKLEEEISELKDTEARLRKRLRIYDERKEQAEEKYREAKSNNKKFLSEIERKSDLEKEFDEKREQIKNLEKKIEARKANEKTLKNLLKMKEEELDKEFKRNEDINKELKKLKKKIEKENFLELCQKNLYKIIPKYEEAELKLDSLEKISKERLELIDIRDQEIETLSNRIQTLEVSYGRVVNEKRAIENDMEELRKFRWDQEEAFHKSHSLQRENELLKEDAESIQEAFNLKDIKLKELKKKLRVKESESARSPEDSKTVDSSSLKYLLDQIKLIGDFLRGSLANISFELFVRSTNHAHSKKINSLIVFNINIQELKEKTLQGLGLILFSYKQVKELIRNYYPKYCKIDLSRKKKAAEIWIFESINTIKFKYGKENNETQRENLKLFRLLAIQYRIRYPVGNSKFTIDEGIIPYLDDKICSALSRIFIDD